MKRRHDIDALRAIAFGFLILYHIGMFYVFDWGWHVKSSYLSEPLQLPMLFMNRWRMDLIFLISGLSTAFLLRKTVWGEFLRQRSWRLLLPLVFGIAFVVPIQPYCQGVYNGLVEPGFLEFLAKYYTGYRWPAKAFDGWEHGFTWNHLWYLAYLWVYTVVLVAAHGLLESRPGRAVREAFTNLTGWRLLIWPAMPLLIYALVLQPRFPQNNALTKDWYAHAVYFSMFLAGWWLAHADTLWAELARLRKVSLIAALLLFSAYMVAVKTQSDTLPPWQMITIVGLRCLYIWTMLCAILGWSATLLNRPFRWLSWANESVYPWYVLHQSLIVGLGFWLGSMRLGPVLEPALLTLGTVAGCWLLNDLVIRRVNFLRPLFGLKPGAKRQQVAEATVPQS